MNSNKILKHVLSNGLTILVWPQHHIPKVSLQLWYDVGAKDEMTGEKGLAHLIEHMIFKGTKILSESDINLITHKLSGQGNAFTSHDYTGYLFDLPSQHWFQALPIMADCMKNCTFKEDLLNSELKAVIQELKMYNDDYPSLMLEKLMAAIFNDHPYHYPVIGFKKDLWSLDRDALIKFYQKHYIPNNATLVVVGDVVFEDVVQKAQEAFGHIEPDLTYQRAEYYHSFDTVNQSITLYREVQQPLCMLAWVIPGATAKQDYYFDALSWALGAGKGSRFNRLLVEDEELVTNVESFAYDLMDYGLFVLCFQPKDEASIPLIYDLIEKELEEIASNGFSHGEVQRAERKTEMDYVSTKEDTERCAYLLGKYYLATKDENYLINYLSHSKGDLADALKNIVKEHLSFNRAHRAHMKPMNAKERPFWEKVQKQSDEEDARILSRVQRQTDVEPGLHVHNVSAHEQKIFSFPRAESFTLSNGLKVIYYHNERAEKIDMVIEFKARGYFDPENKQGLLSFLMDMLQEGTKSYPEHLFTELLESYGMNLGTTSGQITLSLLSKDLKAGLSMIADILLNAEFKTNAIERVRSQILSDIIDFWDNPQQFVGQLAREIVYDKHPYHKSYFGTAESVRSITRDDLIEAYHTYLSPKGATLVVVGAINQYDLKSMLEEAFSGWTGNLIEDIEFPLLSSVRHQVIDRNMNRDQTVLAFAGLSVARTNPDFDKLLLYDQVLTGGVLGSMNSRLFQIREQTGIFYTAGGSLLTSAHLQPGMTFIRTIVSPDRLLEAEKLIAGVLDNGAADLTSDELYESKRAISHALVDNFATNRSMASSFMFLEKFNLPTNFFDTRAQALNNVTVEEVQATVTKNVSTQTMAKIRIGRL